MLDHQTLSLALLVAVFAVYQLVKWVKQPTLDLPIVGSPEDQDICKTVAEGFEKYPDTPFKMLTTPNIAVLPLSMYMETKTHPTVDSRIERTERFMRFWTECEVEKHQEILSALLKDLSKNMNEILPLVQDEVRYGIEELKPSPEWKQIPLVPTIQRMIALTSGRVFVGEPISRSEGWLDLSINYAGAIGKVQDDYMTYTPWLAYTIAPFLKSVRTARNYMAKAQVWLEPLVKEVIRAERNETGSIKPGSPGAFMAWMLQYIPEHLQSTKRLTINQMVNSVAAIHNTANTMSLLLLDLAERPQYIETLRADILAELAKNEHTVDKDGGIVFGRHGFANMKKLDSFIKESQRWSGVFFVPPLYRTTADTTFSNGLRLPKKTRIAFSVRGVAMSSKTPTFSPETCKDAGNPGPEVFDGLRFEKLRNISGQEGKHQAVTTGLDSLIFGHGPKACPGRFFAIYELKAILVELLLNYEFRLVGDLTSQGGEMLRPTDVKLGFYRMPHPKAMLEIRQRVGY